MFSNDTDRAIGRYANAKAASQEFDNITVKAGMLVLFVLFWLLCRSVTLLKW
jgi:hypothetical protein